MPYISVIIPVYNVKDYLERCIASITRQSYGDYEVILVDDGSTDGSGELAERMAAEDARIKVIHQPNLGVSMARNNGIKLAQGEYLIFVDSDDAWLLDDGLEQIVAPCSSKPDVMLFRIVDIWPDGHRTHSPVYDTERIRALNNSPNIFAYLIDNKELRMSTWTLMVRRQLVVDQNIYFTPGIVSEDIAWNFHLWQYVRAVETSNIEFYGYFHHKASLSTTTTIRVFRNYDQILTYWKEQCRAGCVNAKTIKKYLAILWVNRAYFYHQLDGGDRREAIEILQRHKEVLGYANLTKVRLARWLTKTIGVRGTATVFGYYQQLRDRIQHNAV